MQGQMILIDRELLSDLVDAAKWMEGYHAGIVAAIRNGDVEDWDAVQYLSSEAGIIHKRGKAVLDAVPVPKDPADDIPF